MKTRKVISGVLAGAMALAALPLGGLTASADLYSVGDVDMDGVITGHDTALVSRYLHDDTYTLSQRQMILADVDGSGTVDQDDMEIIHGQEEYVLGDVEMEGGGAPTQRSAYTTLCYWYGMVTDNLTKNDLLVIEKSIWLDGMSVGAYKDLLEGTSTITPTTFSAVQRNLADCNLDGEIDCLDVNAILYEVACYSVYSGDTSGYRPAGRYDYVSVPEYDSAKLGNYVSSGMKQGDVDMDGVITGHDSAIVSRSLYEDSASLTNTQLIMADMNCDGTIDQSDLEAIHVRETYTIGDVSLAGSAYGTQSDAYYVMMLVSNQKAGIAVEVKDNANDKNFFTPNGASAHYRSATIPVSTLRYNLMDANGDGVVDYNDAYNILCANGNNSVGGSYYGNVQGRYDLTGFGK